MLARRFKREFGRAPNLKNPRTFDEKLLWLMVPAFGYGPPSTGQPIPRPDNPDEMLHCARSLSRGSPFVRVDLYSVAGHTIFGEMTWQPSAGMGRFVPDRYNNYWGDALPLPAKTRSRLWRARAGDVDGRTGLQ